MIQTENIDPTHSINSIIPNYFITLPFLENETIKESNVTCVFSIMSTTFPPIYKCVGIDYFDKVDNDTLLNTSYGKYLPSAVYVFKGLPFDIDEERLRLIFD